VVALKGLDLTVADGEFLILVGPSGCGKSTALRLLAGLDRPTSGEIKIAGRPVTRLGPGERDIAMVFQNYALYPHMSVFQNLAYGLRQRRTARAEIDRRVRETALLLDIGQLLDRKPGQLSGGQRQRVAMGRALVRRPQAFLLDEPLSNLDAKLRTQVRGDLKRLHREVPITSIYVTHDQVEAMTLGDRICVMSNGEVQQVGTTDDIYNRPANTFVAGFMGSPPMNLLPAVLQGGDLRVAGSALARVASPDRPVTLGVRPEDLHVAGPETTAAIAARVDLCEPLGSHVLLHVLVDADPGSPDGVPPTPVIVQVPPGTVFDSGTRIGLTVSPGKIHLFHAETGAADLTPRRVASA
jgi:sn-glycerol 3-phosphate transport system ATP-binding protein